MQPGGGGGPMSQFGPFGNIQGPPMGQNIPPQPAQQQNQVQSSPQQAQQPSQTQSSPQQQQQSLSQQGNNNISLNTSSSIQQNKKANDLLSKIVDLPFPNSSSASATTPSSSEKLTSTSIPQANPLTNEIRKFNINNNKKQGVQLSPSLLFC